MRYETYDNSSLENTTKLVYDFLQISKLKSKLVLFPSGKYYTEKYLFKMDPPQWRLCWYKGSCGGISPVEYVRSGQ
jgi:hypothetical protein